MPTTIPYALLIHYNFCFICLRHSKYLEKSIRFCISATYLYDFYNLIYPNQWNWFADFTYIVALSFNAVSCLNRFSFQYENFM